MSDPVLEFIASHPQATIRKLANWCAENNEQLSMLSRDQSLDGDTPFEFISRHGDLGGFTFEDLLRNGVIDPNERNREGGSLISIMARKGELYYFQLLLLHQAKIDRTILQISSQRIKDFLRYSPGRGQQSIFDYCCLNYKYNISYLEALIYDAEHTTDAESSGDDLAGTLDVWQGNSHQAYDAQRNAAIERYNQHRPDYVVGNPAEKELAFVTYRGVHFAPKYYNHDRKVAIRANRATVGRPTASYATLQEAGYETDDELQTTPKLTQASTNVQKFFNNMRSSSDKKEKGKVSRNTFAFPNLFYRFIQAYVMDYNYLFSEKAVSQFFGAASHANPAISTSYLAEKAMGYGTGIRFPDDCRLLPHYRRSTQKPKHPYLGFTDCYVIDLEYFRRHGRYILDLVQKKQINISHIYQFECEVLFESLIPGQYHYYRDMFRLPNFSKPWTPQVEEEFGYSKTLWTRHKNEISKITSDVVALDVINRIIAQVIKQRSLILTRTIEHLLHQGALPRYSIVPYTDGQIVADASDISPHDKTKWVRADVEDMSDFNDAFGNLGLNPKAKKELIPPAPIVPIQQAGRTYVIPLWTLDHEIPAQVIHDIEDGQLKIGQAITINGYYMRVVNKLSTHKGTMMGSPGMTKKGEQIWLIKALRGG